MYVGLTWMADDDMTSNHLCHPLCIGQMHQLPPQSHHHIETVQLFGQIQRKNNQLGGFMHATKCLSFRCVYNVDHHLLLPHLTV